MAAGWSPPLNLTPRLSISSAWTCGKRNAPITLADAELSKYADYRGYGAVFSGNKSVHYHFLWNTEHLINAPFDLDASERLERMAEHAALIANAHEQYWDVLNDVVTRLLKPTFEPDKGLRSVTQYRRTPWGIRTLDKDSLLAIPAGTRVPQIVLAERIQVAATSRRQVARVRRASPNKITPVFIQPPGEYYVKLCEELGIDPIRRTDLEERTVHAFYSAIHERQPAAYERLESTRKAIWAKSPFDGARTILT